MKSFQRIEDRKKWLSLLNRVLFKTFFHNLEWEEFLEKQFNWLKFERYIYKGSALLSLAKVKVFGKEKLISHPFCEYGGPLPLVEKIDNEKFRQDLFSEIKVPLRINFHPQLLNYFEYSRSEYAESWRDTYWLENFSQLTQEKLFTSFRYDVRHSIQRAEKQNFNFAECQSMEELKKFYELYIKTVKRHRSIPLPFFIFEFFWKTSKIFFLKSNRKIVTGSIFLFYKPFIHYFITAADYNFRKLGVNHLLLWYILKRYIGKDYNVFDLGATRKGSDLEIFKRGWRGKRVPIFEISTQPVKNNLSNSKFRPAFGLLPCFLIKKFSPYLLKYKL